MATQSFGRREKIRKRNDYLTVYQQGVRSYSEHFTVIVRRKSTGISRLGITVSKKVGNAVRRNRIKRLVREFFRLNKSRLTTPHDIVIIARKDASSLSYGDVWSELESLLIKEDNVS